MIWCQGQTEDKEPHPSTLALTTLCPMSDPLFPPLHGNSRAITFPMPTSTRNFRCHIYCNTYMNVCVCILHVMILGMQMSCYDRTNWTMALKYSWVSVGPILPWIKLHCSSFFLSEFSTTCSQEDTAMVFYQIVLKAKKQKLFLSFLKINHISIKISSKKDNTATVSYLSHHSYSLFPLGSKQLIEDK